MKTLRKKTKKLRNILKYYFGLDKYGLLKNRYKDLHVSKNVTITGIEYISFGEDVFISHNSSLLADENAKISIGNFVLIGNDVNIIGGNHNFSSIDTPIKHQGKGKGGDIIIEDDVWIGAGSIILTGVHIAKGCVIGAGSVVTKSLEPYSIAVGNPAKVIKKRV